ncbi:hypothetical protein [Pedobacter sp. UYEF25]
MKKLSPIFLLSLVLAIAGCKKVNSVANPTQSYIAYFQIDSLNNYLRPSSSMDTIHIREKLKDYALKILKEKSIDKSSFTSSFYSSPTNNGFILMVKNADRINNLKVDKRIDSLHKSIAFKGI